jgi:Histidine kinase
MESLLKFLPPRPQPALVRYGASAVMVLVFFAFRLGAGPAAGQYSFIFFIPPILAASVLFDRGSGFVATVLSAALVGAMLDWRAGAKNHVAALTLFVCVSVFVVIVGEGMRKALERSAAAGADLELMEEQGHRVKNDLAIASALIALQARAQSDPTVRSALESAVARVHVLAKGYDHLRVTERDQATDMASYLGEVCWKLGEGLRGVRPIAVEVDADRVEIRSQMATRIGLIVNEERAQARVFRRARRHRHRADALQQRRAHAHRRGRRHRMPGCAHRGPRLAPRTFAGAAAGRAHDARTGEAGLPRDGRDPGGGMSTL